MTDVEISDAHQSASIVKDDHISVSQDIPLTKEDELGLPDLKEDELGLPDLKEDELGHQDLPLGDLKEEIKNSPEKDATEENEWMDILGNGSFKKKILTPGLGIESRPDKGDEITVNIAYYLNDNLFEETHDLRIILGDLDVVQGVDMVLALMEDKEKARVKIPSKLAYGSIGRTPDVPPYSDIECEIELKEVIHLEEKSLTVTKRLQLGNAKRDRGNLLYGRGDYLDAIHCYERAGEYLDGVRDVSNSTSEELQEIVDTKVKVWNNMAMCHLKLNAYNAALMSVESVLKLQPNNVKALYRKAKILNAKGSTDEAITFMRKAGNLDKDKSIQNELSLLLRKKRKEEESQKAMYRRMFPQSEPKKTHKMSKLVKWSTMAGVGAVLAGVAGMVAYRQFQT